MSTEEDHRRLEAFGGVRGHDADLGAALVDLLALHLGRPHFPALRRRLGRPRHARLCILSQAEIPGIRPGCPPASGPKASATSLRISCRHRVRARRHSNRTPAWKAASLVHWSSWSDHLRQRREIASHAKPSTAARDRATMPGRARARSRTARRFRPGRRSGSSEQRRQRQVVMRLQGDAAKRHQVFDRDAAGQAEAGRRQPPRCCGSLHGCATARG